MLAGDAVSTRPDACLRACVDVASAACMATGDQAGHATWCPAGSRYGLASAMHRMQRCAGLAGSDFRCAGSSRRYSDATEKSGQECCGSPDQMQDDGLNVSTTANPHTSSEVVISLQASLVAGHLGDVTSTAVFSKADSKADRWVQKQGYASAWRHSPRLHVCASTDPCALTSDCDCEMSARSKVVCAPWIQHAHMYFPLTRRKRSSSSHVSRSSGCCIRGAWDAAWLRCTTT